MRPVARVIFSLVACIFAIMHMPSSALAAPFPAQLLLQPQSGLFWLSQGFRLGTEGTDWQLEQKLGAVDAEAELQSSREPLEGSTYTHAAFARARFRIEVENIKSKNTLESYTKRWVKDYFQYGFKILASKPMSIRGTPAVVYDLLSKNKEVQIRQVIQVKNGKAVVMTCSDTRTEFGKVLPACNRMVQNLIWSSAAAAAPGPGPKR